MRYINSMRVRLALQDDFLTIDWVNEYPFPNHSLREIESLLAPDL